MNSDAYFVTGKAHSICQDYACSGEAKDGQPFVVLADGCSSSPHTDIGARLLARSLISRMPLSSSIESQIIMSAMRAHDAAILLKLPLECLDATLLCCGIVDKGLLGFIVGDGVLVARQRETHLIKCWHIQYQNNAPEYPSYHLDSLRYSILETQFGLTKDLVVSESLEIKSKKSIQDFVYIQSFDLKEYDLVAIMSDGVGTFDNMTWMEVVNSLMSFKNTIGAFVQRRMKRFIKECQEKGISHFDDVSMAAIFLD